MKKNNKGFTLIELLAVITIMGILMIVAIPAITRTIENSRKDTFLDTVKQYTNGLKTMWSSDNLVCGTENFASSAVANGYYYVRVDSSDPTTPQILESGGKSSWGSRDIKGYIGIMVYEKNGSRHIDYFPVLVDGIHGINLQKSGENVILKQPEVEIDVQLSRGDILMNNASYDLVDGSSDSLLPVDSNEILNYAGMLAVKCVEA